MKKLLKISALVISSIIIFLLIFNQLVNRSIRTEIVINAPTGQVWKVLMDHQSYPEWNPFIKQITGSTTPGEYLEVTVQSEGNEPMGFRPIVLVNAENEEFRWVGKFGIKGVFDGEHYFILEENASGQTRFIHGESFKGILSGLLAKMILEDTQKGFESMNESLKSRVEKY